MECKHMQNNKSSPKRLLIIDDEKNMRHMLSTLLEKSGYDVTSAKDGKEGLDRVMEETFDIILCDLKMPNMDGMGFLSSATPHLEGSTVIMMSAYGTIDAAVEAMKLGAYDFVSKPFKPDEVLLTLKKAEERECLKRENVRLKEQLKNIEYNYNFGNMVAKSKVMQEIFKLAGKAAKYDTTVLITGESGTGKELIARGIHYSGNRADKPLIPVNCGGIPETLLESELFGHKKGAFTGADRDKKGLFEEAHGGTIFLDEIGELPLSLQVKLLRVLQENEIRPVGDSKNRNIDVRVIAATSKNLQEEAKQGTFRDDLFYRLNVLPIKLPALRDRKEDVPLLCQVFVDELSRKFEKEIKGIAPSAMSILMSYKWPGNVRELENIIERAVIITEDSVLLPENLPKELVVQPEKDEVEKSIDGYSLKEAQKVLEKKMITKALMETGGNRTQASKLLEISHPSLLSKIKAYNIVLPDE